MDTAEIAAAPIRTRTVTWDDPLALALQAHPDRTGLEHLQAMIEGEIPPPPVAVLLGFGPIEAVEGHVTFASTPGEHHYNPLGVVHGGVAATLLDSAMGCAVHTTLAAGEAYTTLELKVNYVRPIRVDTGRVLAIGDIVHRGRSIATAEGRVIAEDSGKLLAHATTTCIIL